MAVLLGKGFRVHHPDAVGGISLTYNPNPKKYMVMQYHSVENGFRLPLHDLLRDLCLHFGFAPGQLTANAHKYVASFILRCCALDKTPTLDEFLLLFSIGGFPFYSLYPHNHFPIFEKVELKIDKWALKYFIIEFPAHSPIDLPGVVLRRSISRTKFAPANLAEGTYNALREKEGLISHHSLQEAKLYKLSNYPLGPDPIPFEEVPSPERSKAPYAAESNPAASSSGDRPQGGSTTLVVRNPDAALDVVPISAIPGLRRPTPSQKRPREGVTDDDFLPKKNRGGDNISVSPSPLSTSSGPQNSSSAATPGSLGLELPNPGSLDQEADEPPGQASLTKPAVQPPPDANNSPPQTVSAPLEPEEKAEGQEEPESSLAAEDEVEVRLEAEISHPEDSGAGEHRDAGAPSEMEREIENQPEQKGQGSTATLPAPNIPIRRKFTPQTYSAFTEGWEGLSRGLRSLQASHWNIQANLERMRDSVQGPTTLQTRPDLLALNALHFMEQRDLAARALQQKFNSLEQQVRILLEENSRLKLDGSTELAAERSKVQSMQDQIANYHRETQDLEVQFGRFRAQISLLESRVSASEDQVGSLKAELVEKESRISELENSLQEAKYGSRLNELALKHMEARQLDLEKLKGERQAASELRAKVDEQEKTIAAHQEEVATLIARAKALYEEGQFDMQQCIYGVVQSGLPENRTLDDFISYYGGWAKPFPYQNQSLNMANNANRVVFIDLTISDSSSLAFPSLGSPTPELSSGPSLASEQSVTSPLPREENNPHLPQQVSGSIPPGPSVLPNSARAEVSSGCLGTSRPQKRRNPHSGASRMVSGARPSSQSSPSPQQLHGQPPEEWGDYDMGGNRLPFIRREKDGAFRDPPPPSV
ncbi:unnamed protein product [Cuscuta campestris]|uniref:Uncharacterized protein n=1 Tax=Cuscuta campestris TaxID=132261 RepID=A0A484N3L6_9ASTE|nr:unnamed protein product [Cuscuta campestris]